MTPNADTYSGAVITAVCAILFGLTFTFATPRGSSDPGMAVWPQTLTLIGMMAGLAMIVMSLRNSRAEPDPLSDFLGKAPGEDKQLAAEDRPRLPLSTIGIALTIVYVAAIKFQLYFVATPVYVAALLWLCGAREWKMILAVVAGLLIVSYGVFYKLLGVPLLSV